MKPLLANRLLLVYLLSFVIAFLVLTLLSALTGAFLGAQLAINGAEVEDIAKVVSEKTAALSADLYQLAMAITLAGLAFWIYKRYALPLASKIDWQPATLSETTRITAWILLLAIGYMMFTAWIVPQEYLSGLSDLYGKPQGPVSVLALLVSMGILAPLLEEWIFRGFMLRSYTLRRGTVYALYAQTLIFAIVHCEPVIALHALFMGWILGRWVLSGGSLQSAFYAHAINNLLSLSTAIFILPHTQSSGQANIAIGVLGLALTLFVLLQVSRQTPFVNLPAQETGPVISGSLVLAITFGLFLLFTGISDLVAAAGRH